MPRILKALEEKGQEQNPYTTINVFLERSVYKKLAAAYYKQQIKNIENNKGNVPFGRWIGGLLQKALENES